MALVTVPFVTAFPVVAQPAAPDLLQRGVGFPEPACTEGVVVDDGSVETGYGWVPSVTDGEYVQRFDRSQFPAGRLDTVCVCWLRTRSDETVDFEVTLYAAADGVPANQPSQTAPGSAAGVPLSPQGAFYPVTAGFTLPPGPFFLGVRWNAAADGFFFLCADQSPETPVVEGFFRENSPLPSEWESVLTSRDPIFDQHRAMLLRAVGGASLVEVPALAPQGLLALAAGLAAVALRRSRRR